MKDYNHHLKSFLGPNGLEFVATSVGADRQKNWIFEGAKKYELFDVWMIKSIQN